MKIKKKKIRDICTKGTSSLSLKDLDGKDGDFPVYGAAGLAKKVNFYQQENKYLAIIKDGSGVGRLYRFDGKTSVLGTMQYIFPSDSIDYSFCYYALQSIDFKKYVNGAAIPHIYFKDYSQEEIPLPAMEEQKKIAARLDAVSDLLAKQKQLLSEQDNLIQSTFYDMFGNPIKNEKGWKFSKISSIYKVRSSQRIHQKDLALSGIPFLRVSDLEKKINCVSPNINLFISDEFFSILHKNRDIPEENDILITTRGTLGDVYIYKNNDRFYFQDGMITWLRPNKNSIIPLFFLYLFKTCEFKNSLHKYKGGTTVAYLSIKNLSDLLIPVPPLELQQKFAAIAEQIEVEKSKIKSAIAEIQTLFNALMSEYFEE